MKPITSGTRPLPLADPSSPNAVSTKDGTVSSASALICTTGSTEYANSAQATVSSTVDPAFMAETTAHSQIKSGTDNSAFVPTGTSCWKISA